MKSDSTWPMDILSDDGFAVVTVVRAHSNMLNVIITEVNISRNKIDNNIFWFA